MAIKYKRSEGEGEPVPRKLPRFSGSPPTRRSLNLIIAGTALVVVLLAMLSNLQSTSTKSNSAPEWIDAVVEFNDVENGQRTLRVTVENESGEQNAYDVNVGLSTKWLDVRAGDTVRLHAQRDAEGTVTKVLDVEPVTEPTAE